MRRLLVVLCRFLAAYWGADRIRVSPLEGQNQRLSAGAVLIVDGRSYVVQSRRVTEQRGIPCLELDCQGRESGAVLRVFRAKPGTGTSMEWETGTGCRPCGVDQIDVYDAGGDDSMRRHRTVRCPAQDF